MGKKKYKKGDFKSGTWVERDLYLSRAYHALRGFAPQLLIMFLGKRDMRKINRKYVCLNPDSITMTYVELENIYNRGQHKKHLPKDGISNPRFARALDDLLAKGFIRIVRHGGAYREDKTIYGLCEDWRIWHPGQVASKRPEDTRQRGYRKPKTKATHETVPIHTHENVPIQQ